MKKTLNISIASRLFNIEEDAYHKLDSYLSSIKSYFHTSPDKTEIITDIEERIAEHFLESKTGIITVDDIESLIKTMGTVEQFAQSDKQDEKTGEKSANSETKSHRPKQLYRDPDDVIVAGVASGISHYFGIDPFILRIVFFASIFAGGTGIITYIILWLVVPEAKTASQKLAMYGDPVTLETLSEAAKERINSIPETSKNRVREWITLPFKIVGNVIRFILDLLPNALRYFFGSILILGSIFVLIGTMLASGFMFSGDILMFEGVTLQEFIPGILRHIITLGMALAIMIPAVCALVGGISLLKKKNILSSYVWLGLLGVWLIAISVSGYGIAKMTQRYDAVITNSPAYQTVTDIIPLTETFTKLEVQNGLDVKIVQGTTTEMKIQGRSASIDSVKTTVQNGTLIIERDRTYNNEQFCFFCAAGYRTVEITLTVARPLETVNVVHGSYVTGELTNSPILNLNIENGSNTEFTVRAQKLTINMIHGSSMTIRGSVMNADINLENGAYLGAKRLETATTKIQAIHGSRADISVSQSLEAIAENGSRISYDGNPEITKTEENGSRISSQSEY